MPTCSKCGDPSLILHPGNLCPRCHSPAPVVQEKKRIRKKAKRTPRPKWRDSLDPADFKTCKACNKPMAPRKEDYPSLYWKRDTHGGKCYRKFLTVIRQGNQNAVKEKTT